MSLKLPNPFVKDPATQQNFDYLQRNLSQNGNGGGGGVGPPGPTGPAGPAGAAGANGAAGADGADALGTFAETKTLGVPDAVAVASGDTDYIVPIAIALRPTEQSARLTRAIHLIHSGTSTTVTLQQNGVALTDYTGVVVSTTKTETDPADVQLADGDLLSLVVTAVSGSPKNLSFALVIEHTVPGIYFETRTFTVPDQIKVAVGDTDYLPPLVIGIEDGSVSLARVLHRINSGTSVTLDLQRNGSGVTGFTGLGVTTATGSSDPTNVALADGDLLAPVVTAVSGTPKNLSLGIVLEHAA